ncbi:MAG: hemin-degrading factor [Candidatus Kapaibacterium sp.]|nr:MAG: hemin-degrading factor [Candidatus Kapabacteria bacterium]
MNPQTLFERWDALRKEHPQLRLRDAADKLHVSEAELLASCCDNDASTTRVVRLHSTHHWNDILAEIPHLGRVMALTRNDNAVHERKGIYPTPETGAMHTLFVSEDIDMRLFMRHWKKAFAVEDAVSVPIKNGDGVQQSVHTVRRSIQFFNAEGHAIHKVFLQDDSNVEAFVRIAAKFRHDSQSPKETVSAPEADSPERPDAEIDVRGFAQRWSAMTDTHEFFGITQKYGVSRTQALRIAHDLNNEGIFPNNFATPIAMQGENGSARHFALQLVLRAAAQLETPIMVFVGNGAAIQIHTGKVHTIKPMGPWINVLDPDFNLHVREDRIVSAWVVRKPTAEGIVTSLECFDAKGSMIVQLFGKRKPGIPELEQWREIMHRLETGLLALTETISEHQMEAA